MYAMYLDLVDSVERVGSGGLGLVAVEGSGVVGLGALFLASRCAILPGRARGVLRGRRHMVRARGEFVRLARSALADVNVVAASDDSLILEEVPSATGLASIAALASVPDAAARGSVFDREEGRVVT